MNLFFLDVECRKSAKYYFNKHCIKIILEIAQMLYTAHWVSQPAEEWVARHQSDTGLMPYKKTHQNHPISRWIRQRSDNYNYACKMGLMLCSEYTRRYNKVHASQIRLEWLEQHKPPSYDRTPIKAYLATKNVPIGCTPVPLAMPAIYHDKDLIKAYRTYYLAEKLHIAHKSETIPTFK